MMLNHDATDGHSRWLHLRAWAFRHPLLDTCTHGRRTSPADFVRCRWPWTRSHRGGIRPQYLADQMGAPGPSGHDQQDNPAHHEREADDHHGDGEVIRPVPW